jgi:hypothetical protein
MNDRDRLKQIRALRDHLERLPASPQRDRILDDVRSRAVDVESGMRAAPMRPLVAEVDVRSPEPPSATLTTPNKVPLPEPSRKRPRRRATPTKTHQARVRDDSLRSRSSVVGAVAAASAATVPRATPLLQGVRLCLDDDPVVSSESDGYRPTAPWARGLRG